MLLSKTISVSSVTLTQHSVATAHFGGNALNRVNISEEGEISPNFLESAAALGLTDLRYPGGFMEDEGDLLAESSPHALAPRLVNFLAAIRQHNTTENPYSVTLGIPTKNLTEKGYDSDSDSYAQNIYDFAHLLGRDYSDVVRGIEIGNEYSIGSEWLSETAYGKWANVAAEALVNGFKAAGLDSAEQPKILIQMAEIFGRGSDYAGTGNHNLANAAIIAQLDDPAINAIDGVVQHYYYIKDHHGSDDFSGSGNGSGINTETRHLRKKIEAWEQQWAQVSTRDLDLAFTEWNVQKSNADQLGLKGAGTLLKQFEYMLELGVDAAHAWPIQHKTPNSLARNPAEPTELTPAGGAFKLLSQNFANPSGSGPARLLKLNLDQKLIGLETVAFRQDYKTLLYMSSRTAQTTQFTIDLRGIASNITTVSAVILGYDPTSSDGLSEMGDENNKNRVAKREISYIEYLNLQSLAFFDDTNSDHITVKQTSDGGVRYLTYLPQFDDILAKISDPKTIDDYYFASETDVHVSFKNLSSAQLGPAGNITFQLDPYEVIELSINHSTKQSGFKNTSHTNTIFDLPQISGTIKIDSLVFVWTAEQGKIWTENDFEDTVITTPSFSLENQLVFGDSASNKIETGAGADFLSGGDGDDILLSAGGDDYISGGAGDDSIDAGAGSDTIEGGSGADCFVFRDLDDLDQDVIRDFNPSQDKLILVGISGGSQLGRFKDIQILETDQGSDIVYGDYRLHLIGIDDKQFSIDDLIFI